MKDELDAALRGESCHDYKTTLQEVIQKDNKGRLAYTVISEHGPDHHKDFTVEVALSGKAIGCGNGQSKKEAEQEAAKDALKKLNHETL